MNDLWAWRAWMAGWVALVVVILSAFGLGVMATLLNSERLGYTEIPVILLGIVIAVLLGVIHTECGNKAPRKPQVRL